MAALYRFSWSPDGPNAAKRAALRKKAIASDAFLHLASDALAAPVCRTGGALTRGRSEANLRLTCREKGFASLSEIDTDYKH